MVHRSLADIERVIRSSWSQHTCDPLDRDVWSTDNPARGQCAATALVVQDLFGGELLLAEVRNADGSRQGRGGLAAQYEALASSVRAMLLPAA